MWHKGVLYVLTPEESGRLCKRMRHCDPDSRSGRMLIAAYDWLQHLSVLRPDQLLDAFEFLDRHFSQAVLGPDETTEEWDPFSYSDRPLLSVIDWTWLAVTYRGCRERSTRDAETINLATGEIVDFQADAETFEKIKSAVTQVSCELSHLEAKLEFREEALRTEGQDAHTAGDSADRREPAAADGQVSVEPDEPDDDGKSLLGL